MAMLTKLADVARILGNDGGDEAGEAAIICPNCGFDCTHVKLVGTLLGSDPGEAEIYPATEQIGQTGMRRSAVKIVFWCEGCPEKFALVIQQHKGVNYVGVEDNEPTPSPRRSRTTY